MEGPDPVSQPLKYLWIVPGMTAVACCESGDPGGVLYLKGAVGRKSSVGEEVRGECSVVRRSKVNGIALLEYDEAGPGCRGNVGDHESILVGQHERVRCFRSRERDIGQL